MPKRKRRHHRRRRRLGLIFGGEGGRFFRGRDSDDRRGFRGGGMRGGFRGGGRGR